MECDRVHCCIVTVAENRGMRVGGGLCKKKKKKLRQKKRGGR